MNTIISPITPDGQVGFDAHGQLCCWVKEKDGDGMIGTIIHDVRKTTCPLCKRGWELTTESLVNQYYIHHLDQMVHKTCYVGYLAMSENEMLYGCLCGLNKLQEAKLGWSAKEIANEYRGAWNTPWYLISFMEKTGSTGFCLKFGTRKRIYSMSLHYDGMDFKPFETLFDGEDVTKWAKPGEIGIHAWSRADVARYLQLFEQIILTKLNHADQNTEKTKEKVNASTEA